MKKRKYDLLLFGCLVGAMPTAQEWMQDVREVARSFDLRLFGATGPVTPGKKVIYLFRVAKYAATKAAILVAYTTQNGRTITAEAATTATKDGTIRTPGTPQVEITATALLAKDDEAKDMFIEAMRDGELMECWEANLDQPHATLQNKFAGTYFQGYVTNFTITSNAEGNTEISLTFAANGTGADGDVTVTAEQQEQASYVFTDTPAA